MGFSSDVMPQSMRHFFYFGGRAMKKIIELKNITKSFDGEVVLDQYQS